MKDVVIFDIDKTLACNKHRENLLPGVDLHETASWTTYNMACTGDSPILDNVILARALSESFKIILVTGRSDVARQETLAWVAANEIPCSGLYMRKHSDNRQDTAVKEDILREIGLDRIVCAFDDSPFIVAHFRKLGITTHQVCEDSVCVSVKSHGVK